MITMISVPSYCIYFPGGGSGNFIASMLIYLLNNRHEKWRPIFHSVGHSHDQYQFYLRNHTNYFQLNPGDAQWIEQLMVTTPWLVLCPPRRLAGHHFTSNPVDIRIQVEPEDLVDISFNHFYKNYRMGLMQYTAPDILATYQQFVAQGVMPQVTDWRNLDVDNTMRLIRAVANIVGTSLTSPLEGDQVIAFQDICQRPKETLERLALLAGHEATVSDLKIYQNYVDLNQQLRDLYWR